MIIRITVAFILSSLFVTSGLILSFLNPIWDNILGAIGALVFIIFYILAINKEEDYKFEIDQLKRRIEKLENKGE
jgi:SNF family Na+-dependent transporter